MKTLYKFSREIFSKDMNTKCDDSPLRWYNTCEGQVMDPDSSDVIVDCDGDIWKCSRDWCEAIEVDNKTYDEAVERYRLFWENLGEELGEEEVNVARSPIQVTINLSTNRCWGEITLKKAGLEDED